MAFRLDRAQLQPPRRRADGSVVYDGKLTRAGVFEYRQPDGSTRREYRPPAEVGHADSLASLKLVHVCDDHPAKRGEAKSKAVGAVGDSVAFDGKFVTAAVMVRDDAVNAKVAHGKSELSCGYDTVLVETPGTTPEGERYDAIQTQIRYEHVAIVAAGRAGPEVRLRLDALEPEDRDDAGIKLGMGTSASCQITSTSLSAVQLEQAVADAAAKIPGLVVARMDHRADAADVAIRAGGWCAPSVYVSSRDLSLDDLTSQLAEALGPGVTVKRGDAATTPHEDTAAMITPEQFAAALKDAADQKARADAAEAKLASAETLLAAEKTRADKAEGERDAAKDRADKADKDRQDALDAGPALARARVRLEDKATAVLGADFKVDGKSDDDLRRAVVEKLTGKPVPADKPAAYVEARYDDAIDTHAAATRHVDAARGAGTRADEKPVMSEREAMAEAKRKADARSQPPAAGN
jgi:hypothetical protein